MGALLVGAYDSMLLQAVAMMEGVGELRVDMRPLGEQEAWQTDRNMHITLLLSQGAQWSRCVIPPDTHNDDCKSRSPRLGAPAACQRRKSV